VRRRTVALLAVGWLLGLLTAFVWPAIMTERQTVVVMDERDLRSVRSDTATGWVVTRSDAVGRTNAVTLERPRYLAVAEHLESWWWDLTSSWREPALRPTPAPPKPTEAPKPTTAPRTP